jgi:hypothetical protein
MIDHRAVITGSGTRRGIAGGLGDEPGNEGILADVAEAFHGTASSGMLK